VCAIPYGQLVDLAARTPALRHALTRQMGQEIVREHALLLVLGSMKASERLGAFLLDVSTRLRERGFSSTEFHLRMSRADIGSYLGMQLETVSRTVSMFQARGLLAADRKHIRLLDLQAIEQAFGHALH
jgi:CRP/FNR family transcriptional regulator